MFAVLGKVVSLRTPGRLLATCSSILGKEQIQIGQVFNVDITPDGRSFRKLEGLPTGKGVTSEARDLVTAGISGTGSVAVNGRWANNCDFQCGAVTFNDNLVDIAVRMPSLGEGGDLSNVLDVIVDLLGNLTEPFGLCDVAEDSRTGGVDEIRGSGTL